MYDVEDEQKSMKRLLILSKNEFEVFEKYFRIENKTNLAQSE